MRKRGLTLLLILFLSAGIMRPLFADAGPPAEAKQAEKLKDIRTLLELTSTVDLAKQTMEQIIKAIKEAAPDASEKFWQTTLQDVNVEALLNRITPIYDKYYTDDEVKELIKFYQSPIGQRVIHLMPQVTQESMTAGQQWGEEISKKIQKLLDDEKNKPKG